MARPIIFTAVYHNEARLVDQQERSWGWSGTKVGGEQHVKRVLSTDAEATPCRGFGIPKMYLRLEEFSPLQGQQVDLGDMM